MNTHDIELPSDDALDDALSNLEHDNYEQSYSGYKNRQADIGLIRAAIEADRKRRGEPVGWQPIETAPKDKAFLAVLSCGGVQTICTMRWPVAEAKNSRPDGGDFHVERVTHWMPLPAAPSTEKTPMTDKIEVLYQAIVEWDEGGGKRSRRDLARRIEAALQSQDLEDAERYRFIREKVYASNAYGRASWKFHYDSLPLPLNNPTKGSVKQHFEEAIDHARSVEGES